MNSLLFQNIFKISYIVLVIVLVLLVDVLPAQNISQQMQNSILKIREEKLTLSMNKQKINSNLFEFFQRHLFALRQQGSWHLTDILDSASA